MSHPLAATSAGRNLNTGSSSEESSSRPPLQSDRPPLQDSSKATDALKFGSPERELWEAFGRGDVQNLTWDQAKQLIGNCLQFDQPEGLTWLMGHAIEQQRPWAGRLSVSFSSEAPDPAAVCKWLRDKSNLGLVTRFECHANRPDQLAPLMTSAECQPIDQLAISCLQAVDDAVLDCLREFACRTENGLTHLALDARCSPDQWRKFAGILPSAPRLTNLVLRWQADGTDMLPSVLSNLACSRVDTLSLTGRLQEAGIKALGVAVGDATCRLRSLTLGLTIPRSAGTEVAKSFFPEIAKNVGLAHLSLAGCSGGFFESGEYSGIRETIRCESLISFEPSTGAYQTDWNNRLKTKAAYNSARPELSNIISNAIMRVAHAEHPQTGKPVYEGETPLLRFSPTLPRELVGRVLEVVMAYGPDAIMNFTLASLPIANGSRLLRRIKDEIEDQTGVRVVPAQRQPAQRQTVQQATGSASETCIVS